MRVIIVFESTYGNTREVAHAAAEGLSAAEGGVDVEVVEVSSAPAAIGQDVDLLLVGGPTHAHGMSNPQSRASAARKADPVPVSTGRGIREWLAGLKAGRAGIPAAAFDTRIKGPGILWGSAAKAADKALRSKGFRMIVPPESFLLSGPTGPVYDALLDGEVERARRWGAEVRSKLG